MFTLIENGNVYTPEPRGVQSVLIAFDKIAKVGRVDAAKLAALDVEVQVVDAKGCIVIPGLIDPHQHLIGGGGEEGFKTRVPEVLTSEIVAAGITSVIGMLGTDTATRSIASLMAKAYQLQEEGVNAYILTGGFRTPPVTVTGSVMNDLVMIERVIGLGEIAIADYRSTEPTAHELARMISEAILGGMIGGKAGVAHFHVGEGKEQLGLLHQVLDETDIPAQHIYPAHVNRTPELIEDAVKLAKRGSTVDMDTTEEKLVAHLKRYEELGGPMDKLTVSSDAHTPGGRPSKLFGQMQAVLRANGRGIEQVLPIFTSNAADTMKLRGKGRITEGEIADITLLEEGSYALAHVFAMGRQMVRDGTVIVKGDQEHMITG